MNVNFLKKGMEPKVAKEAKRKTKKLMFCLFPFFFP